MRLAVIALILLLAASTAAAAPFSNADLKGPIRCGAEIYSWPASPDALPQQFSNGSIQAESDGKGKWTKGVLRQEILVAPAEKAAAGGAGAEPMKPLQCSYDLTAGSYKVNADGSGISKTTWKPAAGSDSRCASAMRPDAYARDGVAQKRIEPGQSVVRFYLAGEKQGYQVGIGPGGFAVGACVIGE